MTDEQYEGPALDAAQVNALLQARATGKVGAILSDAGVPAKTGGRVLAMLRSFAAQGMLVERPVVDEGTKNIVYFDLASRARLEFLDLAAIQILRAFAEERRQIDIAIQAIRQANETVTCELKEMEGLLAILEKEVRAAAIGVAAIGIRALTECVPLKGPEAGGESGKISIADQAATLAERLSELLK